MRKMMTRPKLDQAVFRGGTLAQVPGTMPLQVADIVEGPIGPVGPMGSLVLFYKIY